MSDMKKNISERGFHYSYGNTQKIIEAKKVAAIRIGKSKRRLWQKITKKVARRSAGS